MTASGHWKLTIATPMGAQDGQLFVSDHGDHFSGRIEAPLGNLDVAGAIAGNRLTWVMDIRKPIPLKVTFDVTINGDAMSGTAKMGLFGKAALSGQRISDALAAPATQSATPDLLTEDFVDPTFNQPYVEINELRSEPIPHRYIHGGFKGTDARFSFYFPPAEQYQQRFFHNTYPLALSADIGPFPIQFDVAVGNLGFTLDSGAYYVQTNLGGSDRNPPADPAIGAYRVNAAAAKYSREVAAELYGAHRPFGYLFGGSGGSYQTIGAAENTRGIWDGFLPFVMATPNAIPNMFTVRMHALRVLRQRNKFPGIMDAINPGGSGNPYAELNEAESAALREATLLGFPPRGWYDHATMSSGYFSHVSIVVPMIDPTYVDNFWSKPGYLGSDPQSDIRALRAQLDTHVVEVLPGFPASVKLAHAPEAKFADAHLHIISGAAAGKSTPISSIDGHTVGFAFAGDPAIGPALQPGDRVRLDNSWPLALQTFHRHQVPGADQYAWNQFRDERGEPRYPQRDILTGPLGAAGTAGSVPDGSINGKMLVLQSLMDIDAMPWQADWYRTQVSEKLGAAFADNFALWFIDHAQHDNPLNDFSRAHIVSFAGALQQGLRDLSAWVEQGIRPAQTNYAVTDTQVQVSSSAAERGGIQPVVALQVNGGVRADIAIGTPATFTATIDVPPNAGSVVAAEWDFEGAGTYPVAANIEAGQTQVQLTATHAYTRPGTYFAVLRATSQRQGDRRTPYGRVQNLARVRVVVS